MPDPAFAAEQYCRLVHERLSALRQLLNHFKRGAPKAAPGLFLKSIQILIDTIGDVFASRTRTTREGNDMEHRQDEEVIFTARWSLQLLTNVQETYFPLLEKLDSPHVPLAILPALQRMAKQFEPDTELYLLPTSEHNYGFSGFRNLVETFLRKFEGAIPEHLIPDIRKASESLPSWAVFLSLPYVAHDSALNLTPLLHELGHFADFQLGIYERVLPFEINNDAAKSLVERICQTKIPFGEQFSGSESGQPSEALPRLGQVLRRDVIEQEVFKRCGDVITNWVHELIADLLAVNLGGPAYFYAFVAYAAGIGLDAPSADSHPAHAIRVDFMLKELTHLQYYSDLSPAKIRTSLQLWSEWVAQQKLEPEEEHMRIAYLAVMENATKLVSAVRPVVHPSPYGMETFVERVPNVTSELEQGIPPIDQFNSTESRSEPREVADILNGGWSAYLFSLEKLENLLSVSTSEKQGMAVNTLNQLILKALESSEILRTCYHSPEKPQ